MIYLQRFNEMANYEDLYESFIKMPVIVKIKNQIIKDYGSINNYEMKSIFSDICFYLSSINLQISSYYDTNMFSGNGHKFYDKSTEKTDSVFNKNCVVCVVKEDLYPGKTEDICYKIDKYNKIWYKFKIISRVASSLTELVLFMYISEDYMDTFFNGVNLIEEPKIKTTKIEEPKAKIEEPKIDPIDNMKKLLSKIRKK